jgi:prolyl oligopeptidase PreP (S9A serine peptidase family)
MSLKTKSNCPLCKIPILRRTSILPLQSLNNLVEQFNILMRKFEKDEENEVIPSPLKKFFHKPIDDSIIDENLFEIDLSQNGYLERVKKIQKEIEKNGILNLLEDDYKFINEFMSKEYKMEDFEKEIEIIQEENNQQDDLPPEEEEETQSMEISKNEIIEEEEEEENVKKRKRETEFQTSTFDPSGMVIIGTVLDSSQTKLLKSCIKKLGGKFVTKYTDNVTHVITSVNTENIVTISIELKVRQGGH